jgi:hypothetical protein
MLNFVQELNKVLVQLSRLESSVRLKGNKELKKVRIVVAEMVLMIIFSNADKNYQSK